LHVFVPTYWSILIRQKLMRVSERGLPWDSWPAKLWLVLWNIMTVSWNGMWVDGTVVFLFGMLNDYRIFDHRIKWSFSISSPGKSPASCITGIQCVRSSLPHANTLISTVERGVRRQSLPMVCGSSNFQSASVQCTRNSTQSGICRPSASKVFTTITSSPPDSVNTLSTLCQSSARQASQRLRILDVKLTCNDNVPTECDLHAQRHCCWHCGCVIT